MSRTLADCIEFLVRSKYPGAVTPEIRALRANRIAAAMQAGIPLKEVDPAELKAELKLARDAEQYRNKLRKMSRVRVERMCAEEEERQLFFNQPNARADFPYWAKFDTWTHDQTVALLLGRNPEIVTWEKMQRYVHEGGESPFARKYMRLSTLLHAAGFYAPGAGPTERRAPLEVLAWARRKSIRVPRRLAALVESKQPAPPSGASTDAREQQRPPAQGAALRGKEVLASGPLQRQSWQENEILSVITKLGYDPIALPKEESGKPGVKAKVREQLLKNSRWTITIFDKAWQRLREQKRIKNVK